MNYAKFLTHRIFRLVGELADARGQRAYVIGGYVRDLLLRRPSTDIDIVVEGSGIELCQATAKRLGGVRVSVFRNFGTAMLRYGGQEVEFVGARRESYSHDSRKPAVEDGSIADDQLRRDFTINALALSLNADTFGDLEDPFEGMRDLEDGIIRTPQEPEATFSDDPLRMLRAIRFATRFDFTIEERTLQGMTVMADRISIVSGERVADELTKAMRTAPYPSSIWKLLDKVGLLSHILPELRALRGVEKRGGYAHKDNFAHTMQVLDGVAAASDNEWLRWAALLHDIGKPRTKRFEPGVGWTFHNHNYVGAKMIPRIFARMKLPQDERMKYVCKLVDLHMRPIVLSEDIVTDSAVRRLLFEAGDDIDALMTLCEADITSRNEERVERYLRNFKVVRRKLKEIEEKDHIRNFQPPVTGEEVMRTFGIPPSRPVGQIKEAIKEAILDGRIHNDYSEARALMLQVGAELGLSPVTGEG